MSVVVYIYSPTPTHKCRMLTNTNKFFSMIFTLYIRRCVVGALLNFNSAMNTFVKTIYIYTHTTPTQP